MTLALKCTFKIVVVTGELDEFSGEKWHGKTNNVFIVSFNFLHQKATSALNAVGSCFV